MWLKVNLLSALSLETPLLISEPFYDFFFIILTNERIHREPFGAKHHRLNPVVTIVMAFQENHVTTRFHLPALLSTSRVYYTTLHCVGAGSCCQEPAMVAQINWRGHHQLSTKLNIIQFTNHYYLQIYLSGLFCVHTLQANSRILQTISNDLFLNIALSYVHYCGSRNVLSN